MQRYKTAPITHTCLDTVNVLLFRIRMELDQLVVPRKPEQVFVCMWQVADALGRQAFLYSV